MDKEQMEFKKQAENRILEMLNNLEEAKRVATQDLSGWDRQTMNGAQIRKREAEDMVEVLKAGYRTTIENTFVKVFVSGNRAEEFAQVAERKGYVVLDGTELYRHLAIAVEPSMDPRERTFTGTQVALLVQVIQRYMQQHKIYAINQPKIDANEMGIQRRDSESVVDVIRKAVRNTNGDDILAVDLSDRALDKALEKRVAKLAVPVIVTGLSADEAQSLTTRLFGGRPTVSLEATHNTTDEDLFQQLDEQIKKVA